MRDELLTENLICSHEIQYTIDVTCTCIHILFTYIVFVKNDMNMRWCRCNHDCNDALTTLQSSDIIQLRC